jgi:hypothetical protein
MENDHIIDINDHSDLDYPSSDGDEDYTIGHEIMHESLYAAEPQGKISDPGSKKLFSSNFL